MSSAKRLVVAVVGLFAVATACTNDYDGFDFSGEAGASATGGTAASGGVGGGVGGAGNVGNVPGVGGTTGGVGGTTGGTGAAGGVGGTTGGVGGATGGTGGEPPTCEATEKACNGVCVPNNDPATGCASPSCEPCDVANATARCFSTGVCLVDQCNAGFANCDLDSTNGCEVDITSTASCGGCNRPCSTASSLDQHCINAVCQHSCATGFANCTRPAGGDDGCETNVSTSNTSCGGCSNNCSQQGASGGLTCQNGLCGCTTDAQCRLRAEAGYVCNVAAGVCECAGMLCNPGEACNRVGGNDRCVCGTTGPSCAAGQVCCQSPAGCVNVDNDVNNCGGCGRACLAGQTCCGGTCIDTTSNPANCGGCGTAFACTTGQGCCNGTCADLQTTSNCGACGTTCASGQSCCGTCVNTSTSLSHCGTCNSPCRGALTCSSGQCVCAADADCSAGGTGTCGGGLCTCGGTQCAQGQRCVVGDVCGVGT